MKSSANGRLSTRSSTSCRASSRLPFAASETDRAAIPCTTSAWNWCATDGGELGFEVLVGGGLGRTPVIGEVIRDWLPEEHLLTYLEAILRVYNQLGRRDNKYKARIKILVKAMTSMPSGSVSTRSGRPSKTAPRR